MRLALLLLLVTACTPKVLEYDDADLDGVPASEDCDDADPSVFPGAVEVCNGLDDDCDGTVDEDALDAIPWYTDADGDGYGDPATAVRDCDPDGDVVSEGGDCDDTDTAWHPGAVEDDCTDPNDYNCDGSVGYEDADGDGWAACEDCDDDDEDVNPDADETCNGEDDDCDGMVDEDPVDGDTWYQDADADGYGDPDVWQLACDDPGEGWLADGTDCDDGDASQNPGADELCATDEDDDCDGTINEDDAADATTWYADADGDGFGDLATTTDACEQPSGYEDDPDDCDDTDDTIHPDADETCDGEDDDCDGDVDEDDAVDATTWYADADEDGYGDPDTSTTACSQPSGYEDDSDDCDDTDDTINPDADESCDGEDNDCDGTVDEDDAVDASTWYADDDGDGYGDPLDTDIACDQPSGYEDDSDDCDDTDATVYPGADEYCDGEDDDCDGTVDEDDAVDVTTWYADTDGDGYGDPDSTDVDCDQPSGYEDDALDCDDSDATINPGATDHCDGVDDDCSGDEDGLVTYTSTLSASPADHSSSWAAGTSSSPATLSYTADGDIAVCPGTYYVLIDASGSGSITGPYGSATTILDGGGSDSVLNLTGSGETVSVEGLTFQDGATWGGGIDSDDATIALTLLDVVVTGSDGDYGGGIYFEGGTLDATELVLDANTADYGGGLYAASGAVTLTDCAITDNAATYSGGGIDADGSTDVDLDGCTVSGNTADGTTGDGGGALATGSGDVSLVDSTFYDNDATTNAGGVAYLGEDAPAGTITVQDCTMYNNSAVDEGGAVLIQGGSLTFTDSHVYSNTADYGGGIYIYGAEVLCEATTSGTYGFTSNTASTAGGAAYLEDRYLDGDSEIESDTCDWGTSSGGDDNDPEDLYGAGGLNRTYGDNYTFTCDDDNTCTT